MSDKILMLIESEIRPGKEEELRKVVGELKQHVAATEPGTLRYDWFINTADQTLLLVEEYDSIESAGFHGANYKEFRERLEPLREVVRRTVCGDFSDEVKAMLKPLNPEYFETL
jgi:quinol monooxygenase YgiN